MEASHALTLHTARRRAFALFSAPRRPLAKAVFHLFLPSQGSATGCAQGCAATTASSTTVSLPSNGCTGLTPRVGSVGVKVLWRCAGRVASRLHRRAVMMRRCRFALAPLCIQRARGNTQARARQQSALTAHSPSPRSVCVSCRPHASMSASSSVGAGAAAAQQATDEADLAALLATLGIRSHSHDASSSSSSPIDSMQSSHICAWVLEGMRTRLEGSDAPGHSVRTAEAAWRFLSVLYVQAETNPQPALIELVQSAAVSHALLLLQEPGLFVEDQPAPPPAASANAPAPPPPAAKHSLLPVLLGVILTWLGDIEVKLHTQSSGAGERCLVALPAAQQSPLYRFFKGVWEGVLEGEAAEAAEAGAVGIRLPEESDQPNAKAFFPAPARNSLTSLLFAGASAALRQCSLLDAAMLTPLRALRVLLSFPALARQFVSLDEFIHPWMNGYLLETGNVFASVLKATCLPDDPVVGDAFFATPYINGQLMPDVEREFVMNLLHKKTDAHHAIVADIFEELLGGSNLALTRSGILAWLGCAMLANYTRTRMAASRRSASNDGFLLNLGAVLLRIWSNPDRRSWAQSQDDTIARIDARFAIHGIRLEMHDETRLAASIAELTAWAQGQADPNKFQAPQAWRKAAGSEVASSSSSSAAAVSPSQSASSAFFLSALKPRHPDIVCDHCRSRNFEGPRFKCAQCNDYDVCAACATGEFAESLGFAPKSGVLFACPYRGCMVRGLTDIDLRAHVAELHTADLSAVCCPICAVNAGGVPFPRALFQNPHFLQHLQHDHGDTHDPLTHVMVKVDRMVPHVFHRRLFQAVPPFPLQPIAPESIGSSGSSSSSPAPDLRLAGLDTSSGAAYLAECARVQSQVVHRGVSCDRCHTTDLRGVCYRCAHCPNYNLCARCEAAPPGDHPAWHSFLQMRRALVMDGASALAAASSGPTTEGVPVSLPQLPMSLMYASALTGASPALPFVPGSAPPVDPSLESSFFFLILHSLHVGFCKTCARYTSLVQALDVEADPRAIETLLKVKLCVDAQLLQPSLLAQALSLYVLACKWMLSIIDPQAQGLPLPAQLPMEFAALPEYLVEDASELLLFLSRFAIDIVAGPDGRGVDIAPMLRLFTMLLATPTYCTNPYLRAKLVEVLCSLADNACNAAATLTKRPTPPGLLSVLSADRFMQTHLVGALVRLYVDIEHTGSASSFYEKFNVRHAVGVLLKLLTAFIPYADALNAECQEREDRVVQFENALINDLVFLIDESMMKAQALHTLQTAAPAASVAARRANADQQAQLMRSLRTASVLAGHTVSLLSLLCSSPGASAILSRPELLSRVLQFINQFVSKVANPTRRATLPLLASDARSSAESAVAAAAIAQLFPADDWLRTFAHMYLQLQRHPAFMDLMAKEETGFNEADFQEAETIISRSANHKEGDNNTAEGTGAGSSASSAACASSSFSSSFSSLVQSVSAAHARASLVSAAGSGAEVEVPDEFLDPILSTLMSDPVTLPSSGVNMDRAVLQRHLLNAATDPFNRAPLRIEQVVPNEQLKQRIRVWREQQQANNGSATPAAPSPQ